MTNSKTLLEMAIETYDRWDHLAQIAHLNKKNKKFSDTFDTAKQKIKALKVMFCNHNFFFRSRKT